MNIRKYALGIICSAAAIGAHAQNSAYMGGQIPGQVVFGINNLVDFAQYNYGFNTARSSAMGGAFTSLGADLSATSLNPAGLGMYQMSEWGVTAAIGSASYSSPMLSSLAAHNRTRFALNNVGLALNLYEGTGNLISFTLGLTYNKLADFNYRWGVENYLAPVGNSAAPSIGDIFVNQLNGIPTGWLGSSADPFNNYNIGVDEWGATLGYLTSLVDPVADGAENKLYTINAISAAAGIRSLGAVSSKGSVGEYNIAGGMNINNILYLGFGIGIQDIYQDMLVRYEEAYDNNPGDNNLRGMVYEQRLVTSGVGFNFKLGAILRPVEGLRIGVSVQTPTFVSMNKDYSAAMMTDFNAGEDPQYYTPHNIPTYKYNTPTRLSAGVSYTISDIAILSVDYERVWYNGMRVRDVDERTKDAYKQLIKEDLQGANNIRAGLEIRPLPQLALRAGYALYGDLLKDNNLYYNNPVSYRTENISAGIGYRFGAVALDFTYVHMTSKNTVYDLFRYESDNAGFYNGNISTKLKRNNFILSFSVRF